MIGPGIIGNMCSLLLVHLSYSYLMTKVKPKSKYDSEFCICLRSCEYISEHLLSPNIDVVLSLDTFISWFLILTSAESPYYHHQLQVWFRFCVTTQLAESSGFCSHAPSPHPGGHSLRVALFDNTALMEFLHEIISHSSFPWLTLSLVVTLDSRISFPIIVTQANPVLALIMPGQAVHSCMRNSPPSMPLQPHNYDVGCSWSLSYFFLCQAVGCRVSSVVWCCHWRHCARKNKYTDKILDSLLAIDLVRVLFYGIRDAHCTARAIHIIGPYFHCMSSFRHKPLMTLHPAHSVATHNPLWV